MSYKTKAQLREEIARLTKTLSNTEGELERVRTNDQRLSKIALAAMEIFAPDRWAKYQSDTYQNWYLVDHFFRDLADIQSFRQQTNTLARQAKLDAEFTAAATAFVNPKESK